MNWKSLQEIVGAASGTDSAKQVQLIESGRLFPEAIGAIYGEEAKLDSIEAYLKKNHPTWDAPKFITDLNVSGKLFTDFVTTYKP